MDSMNESEGSIQSTPRLVIDESQFSTHSDGTQKSSEDSDVPPNTKADADNEKTGQPVIVIDNQEHGTETMVNKREVESKFEPMDTSKCDKQENDETTRAEGCMSPRTKERMSIEEIKRSFEELGNHRCPFCIFMTSELQLYETHKTICNFRTRAHKPTGPLTSQPPFTNPAPSNATTATSQNRPSGLSTSHVTYSKPAPNTDTSTLMESNSSPTTQTSSTYRQPAASKSTPSTKASSNPIHVVTEIKSINPPQDGVYLKFSYEKVTKEFVCHRCDRRWTDRPQFEEHVVCHTIELPYICLTCKKNYSSRQYLEMHSKNEHPKGDARCGLRGIKRGRKIVEDAFNGVLVMTTGKVDIPHTPRNAGQFSVKSPDPSPAKSEMVASTVTCLSTLSGVSSSVSTTTSSSTSETTCTVTDSRPLIVTAVSKAAWTEASMTVSVSSAMPDVSICVTPKAVSTVTASSQVTVTSANDSKAIVNASDLSSNLLSNDSKPPTNQSSTDTVVIGVDKIKDSESENKNAATIKSELRLPALGGKNTSLKLSSETTVTVDAKKQIKVAIDGKPIYNIDYKPVVTTVQSSPAVKLQTTSNVSGISSSTSKMGTVCSTGGQEEPTKQKYGMVYGVKNPPNQQLDPALVSAAIKEIVSQFKTETASTPYVVKSFTELKPAPPYPGAQELRPGLLLEAQPVGTPPGIGPLLFVPVSTQSIGQQKTMPSLYFAPSQGINQQTTTTQITGVTSSFQGQSSGQLSTGHQTSVPPTSQPGQPKIIARAPQQPITPPVFVSQPQIALHPTPRLSAHTIVNRSQYPISIQYPIAVTQGQVVLAVPPPQSETSSSTSFQPGPGPRNMHVQQPTVPQLTQQQHQQQQKQSQPGKVVVGTPPGTKQSNTVLQSKKFVFCLKPNQGFVCEDCKKFTKDEMVFKKHAWEHFHGNPSMCKYCSTRTVATKDIFSCELVSTVVENLKKSSQNEMDMFRTLNVKVPTDGAVIDITGDDEKPLMKEGKSGKHKTTEVIVIDDNDEDNSGGSAGMQIKISGAYSLATLQDMNKDNPGSDSTRDKSNVSESKGQEQETNIKGKAEGTKSVNKPKTTIEEKDKEIVEIPDEDNEKVTSKAVQENKKATETGKKDTSTTKAPPEKSTANNVDKNVVVSETKDKAAIATKDTKSKDDQERQDSARKPSNEPDEERVTSFISEVLEFDKFDLMNDVNKDQEHMEVDEVETAAGSGIVGNKLEKVAIVDEKSKEGLKELDNTTVTKHAHEAFYLCGFEDCMFVCLSSHNYREHLKCKKHEKEYCYVCGHCGQKDYVEDGHVRHLLAHANMKRFCLYNCPVRLCKFKTNLIKLYAEHVKAHQTEELTIICTYCHKTFPTVESLIDHLQQNLLKFVACPYCTYRFVNRSLVIRHMRLCHPDRARMVSVSSQIVCNEREINFYVNPKVKQLKAACLAQLLIGETEGENLDISAILEEAQKSKTPEDTSNDGISEVENDGNEHEDEADSDTSKKSKTAKKQSDENKSDKLNILDSVGPKSLQCRKCSYLSYNSTLFTQHMSYHNMEPERHKRFLCNLCPKGQKDFSGFKRHVSNHVGSNEIKLYNCIKCSFISNQKSHIMDHCEDAHDLKSLYTLKVETIVSHEFSCKYCYFKARNAEHVYQHEQIVHKVKPVQSVEPMVKQKEPTATQVLQTETRVEQRSWPSTPRQTGRGERNPQAENTSNQSRHEDISNERRNREEETTSTSESEQQSRKKRKYHCELCKKFFKHKQNLKEHMTTEHPDVEDKQFVFFKCKYCAYTSTMKEIITNHIRKKHSGEEIRILRKIETVDQKDAASLTTATTTATSAADVSMDVDDHDDLPDLPRIDRIEISRVSDNDDQEAEDEIEKEVVVPDGNTFKDPFYCPKCTFSSNLRIHTMRHLRDHQELKPTRPAPILDKQSGKTARKSTSLKIESRSSKKRTSILSPIAPLKIQNPFKQVKEAVSSMSSSPTASHAGPMSSSKDFYVLGEHNLHAVLAACFIPVDKELRFKCRMCKQKIAKKFVLHRHILDHLKVVFFKCNYCDEGAIERTLLMSHIQKQHSSKPLMYMTLGKAELEHTIKERILKQDFNDTVDIFASSSSSNTTVSAQSHGLKIRSVHEGGEIISDSEREASSISLTLDNPKLVKPLPIEIPMKPAPAPTKPDPNKCPKCRYVGPRKGIIKQHISYHDDPEKRYTCSGCDFRGDRFSVIKHIYRTHGSQCKVVEDTTMQPVKKSDSAAEKGDSSEPAHIIVSDSCSSREENPEVIDKTAAVKPRAEKQMVTNKDGNSIPVDSLCLTRSGAYEMKMIYKCKICGEKKYSRRSLYNHFNSTKCKSPFYGCSVCKFQNSTKVGIYKHGQIRHKGKKVIVETLPSSAKIKTFKIPIKQDNQVEKILKKRMNESLDISTDAESESDASESKESREESEDEAKSVEDNTGLKCMLCKSFNCDSPMRLQNHINTIHQGVHIHCQKCSYSTPLIKHMLNHCKNVHLQDQALYADRPYDAVKKSPSPKKPSLESSRTQRTPSSDRSSVTSYEKTPKAGPIPIKCPKCVYQTVHRFDLRPHLFVHYNYRPYSCGICKRSFTSKKAWSSHFAKHHPKKEPKCKYQGNVQLDNKIEQDFTRALKQWREVRMARGLDRTKVLDKLDLVAEGIRKQNSKLFFCDTCGFKRTSLVSMKQHIDSYHTKRSSKKRLREEDSADEEKQPTKISKTEAKPGTSNKQDGRSEARPWSMAPAKVFHVDYTADGERIFCCERCSFQAKLRLDMKRHYTLKHEGKAERVEYACLICGFKYQNVCNVYRHVRQMHPEVEVKAQNLVTGKVMAPRQEAPHSGHPRSQSPARSVCSESSETSFTDIREFLSSSPLKSDKSAKKPSGHLVYSCHLCAMETGSLFFFRLHLATHGECQYTQKMMEEETKCCCAYCSFVAPSEFEHKIHLDKHPSERKYQCLYCVYTSFEKHTIMNHSKAQHTDRHPLSIDRDTNAVSTGKAYLVDIYPDLKLKRVSHNQLHRKKYRRIRMESDSDSQDEDELFKLVDQIFNSTTSTDADSLAMNVDSQEHVDLNSSQESGPPTLEPQLEHFDEPLIATPVSEESMDFMVDSEPKAATLFSEHVTDKQIMDTAESMTIEPRDRCYTQSFDVVHDMNEDAKKQINDALEGETNLEYVHSSAKTISESRAMEQIQNSLTLSSQGFDYQSESEHVMDHGTGQNSGMLEKLERQNADEPKIIQAANESPDNKVVSETSDKAQGHKDETERIDEKAIKDNKETDKVHEENVKVNKDAVKDNKESNSDTVTDPEEKGIVEETNKTKEVSILERDVDSVVDRDKFEMIDQDLDKKRVRIKANEEKPAEADNDTFSDSETTLKISDQYDTEKDGASQEEEKSKKLELNASGQVKDGSRNSGATENFDTKPDESGDTDKLERNVESEIKKTDNLMNRVSEIPNKPSSSKEPSSSSKHKDIVKSKKSKPIERVGIFNQFETEVSVEFDDGRSSSEMTADEKDSERGNIFEKFDEEAAFADDQGDQERMEDENCGDQNIFDKFNVKDNEPGDDGCEPGVEINVTVGDGNENDDNIFEKFSVDMSEEEFFVVDEIQEGEDSGEEASNEDNIFDKMKSIGAMDSAEAKEKLDAGSTENAVRNKPSTIIKFSSKCSTLTSTSNKKTEGAIDNSEAKGSTDTETHDSITVKEKEIVAQKQVAKLVKAIENPSDKKSKAADNLAEGVGDSEETESNRNEKAKTIDQSAGIESQGDDITDKGKESRRVTSDRVDGDHVIDKGVEEDNEESERRMEDLEVDELIDTIDSDLIKYQNSQEQMDRE